MCNVETLALKTVHLKAAVVKIDVLDKVYIGPDVSGFACFFLHISVYYIGPRWRFSYKKSNVHCNPIYFFQLLVTTVVNWIFMSQSFGFSLNKEQIISWIFYSFTADFINVQITIRVRVHLFCALFEWNNNCVKKVNLANNAFEHWDIYFSFVITTCCFNYLTARK